MITLLLPLGRLTNVTVMMVVMVALWSNPLIRPVSGECCEPTWTFGCAPTYNVSATQTCLDCKRAYFIFHNCGFGCNLFGCACDSCRQLAPGVFLAPKNYKPIKLHNEGRESVLPREDWDWQLGKSRTLFLFLPLSLFHSLQLSVFPIVHLQCVCVYSNKNTTVNKVNPHWTQRLKVKPL